MKNKVLIICIVLISILSIGIASATSQEIGGVTFNIPDEYSSSSSLGISLGDMDYAHSTFGNGENNISITVEKNDGGNSLDEIIKNLTTTSSFENTTIAGITGYSDMTEFGFRFIYLQGDKVVYVVAPDESTIESIIAND